MAASAFETPAPESHKCAICILGAAGDRRTSDLRDWLRGNNLEQYADAFEANDIDLDILAELTDRDLEQLGLSLGNRRRLLKAIAGRGAELGPPKPAPRSAGIG